MGRTSVYSMADVQVVMYHQDVGRMLLSGHGLGKITIAYAGDISSHTPTADGYVVVNKLRNSHGLITVEVPQNSEAAGYLRRWADYLKDCDTYLFALTALNIVDPAGGFTVYCEGVTPQKKPDRIYDQTSSNMSWVLLAASIKEG